MATKEERRINLYFSDRRMMEDAVYEYFNDMANKQDIMKNVLYEYVKSQEKSVTKNSQKPCSTNTKITQKSVDSVTKTTPKIHKNVTKTTQNGVGAESTLISVNLVTKNAPISEEVVTKITHEKHEREPKATRNIDIKAKMKEKNDKLNAGLNFFNKKK